MTQYIKSPFKPTPALGVANQPTYVLGSFNDKTGPTQGYVISDSAATTVGTLVFQIVSGNAPVAGALITVVGTANGSGNLNVTNVAIASVTTTLQGVCTVTYTIPSTTFTSAQDFGQVIIPQPVVGEDVTSATANGSYASVPVAKPANNPVIQDGDSITVTVVFPTVNAGASCVLTLQGANQDLDAAYTDIAVILGVQGTPGTVIGQAIVAGQYYNYETGTYLGQVSSTVNQDTAPGNANISNFRFYRLKITQPANFGAAGATLASGLIQF